MFGQVEGHEVVNTVPLLLVLILAGILFGSGFAVKILWWVALAVLVVWLLGFVMRSTSADGGRRPLVSMVT